MGLLDNFDAEKLMTNPLLNVGLGIMANSYGPRGQNPLGAALGRGTMMGMQTTQEARQAQLVEQMRKMQMDQMMAAQQQAAAKKSFLSNSFAGASPAAALANGGGPTVENAAKIGARTDFDPRAALLAGFSPQEIEAFKNLGKSKIKEYKEVSDGNGGVTLRGFDEYGNPVDTNSTPWKAPHFQNLGDKTVAIDPVSLRQIGDWKQGISPDAAASNALGWSRLNWDKTQANKPVFNADSGGFITAPSDMKPGEFRKVEGITKPFTEAQGKAAGFADRMYAAEKTMNDPSTKEMPSLAEAGLGAMPGFGGVAANAVRTPERQQYRQAQEDWVRAKLRKESGAVIGENEMDQEVKTYFPQIGDSPQVIAQKAEARRIAAEGIAREAGSGYKPQEMPKARSKQFDVDGSKVIATLESDGNYYVKRGGKKYRVEE